MNRSRSLPTSPLLYFSPLLLQLTSCLLPLPAAAAAPTLPPFPTSAHFHLNAYNNCANHAARVNVEYDPWRSVKVNFL